MDFLELAQMTSREGDIPGTGPAAVTGLSGQELDIVNWVIRSWNQIQNRHPNWRWMRHEFTLNTVADDDTYVSGDATDDDGAITRFKRWWVQDPWERPKIYKSSSGVGTETWMTYLPWLTFKHLYRIGTQNSGHPIHITIDPQNNLVVGPKPDAVYVISGVYQRSAQTLALAADIPEMPEDYHELIAWRAVEKHAIREAQQEILIQARGEANRLMRQLELDQLPELDLAEPLA